MSLSSVNGRIARELEGCHVVLDMGCGDGALARYLGSCGHEVIGIDVNPDVLPADEDGLHFMMADATSLPFATGSFDAVIMSMLLHVTDAGLAMAEARRVLADVGTILIVGVTAESGLRARFARRPEAVDAPTLGWGATRSLVRDFLPGASFDRLEARHYLSVWRRDNC